MAKHSVHIRVGSHTKCELSGSETDEDRNTPLEQSLQQLKDSPNKYSSTPVYPAGKKLRRRPGLCNLAAANLLKQRIFNSYPSTVRLRFKESDQHPSKKLKHIRSIEDLRKAAAYLQSTDDAPKFPVSQHRMNVADLPENIVPDYQAGQNILCPTNRPAAMDTQTVQPSKYNSMTTASYQF